MDRKKKLLVAYILWAINTLALFSSTSLNDGWLKTALAFIWLFTLPVSITFSILGHLKTKEERVIKKKDREIKRRYIKYSLRYKMFLIFSLSFVMVSSMVPAIIGCAVESVKLVVIGLIIQIVLLALLLVYYVVEYIKNKEKLGVVITTSVCILVLLLHILYVLGVEQMSYPLVIIIFLSLMIMAIFGGGIDGGEETLYLLNNPFTFANGGVVMTIIIYVFMVIPTMFFIIDILNKTPKQKVIKVYIDENGNKEITEEEK